MRDTLTLATTLFLLPPRMRRVSSVAGNSAAPVFVRMRYRETEDRTFGGAIRDALRDGYGYYDLTVNMPVDVRRLEMAVNISEPIGGNVFHLCPALCCARKISRAEFGWSEGLGGVECVEEGAGFGEHVFRFGSGEGPA